MSRDVPQYHLRAEGNLSYPEFMRALESVWKEVNPNPVPLYSYGVDKEHVTYPCVIFNLTSRRPTDEIKPRVREELPLQDGSIVRIRAQRFLDTVTFIVCTDGDPRTADLLAEAFEAFMLEYTGVFKRLGLSELTYGQRYKNSLDTTWGENIVTRWVDYHAITEKVYVEDQIKLEALALHALAQIEGTEEIISNVPS